MGLVGVLVMSIAWSNAGSSTWAAGGGNSGFSRALLRASSSHASSARNTACRFDYPGPLRPESYDCYAEYFPPIQPFSFPEMTTQPGRSFSLNGVTWADANVPRVPIIILFKDRVSVLMETLRGFYRCLGTPYEVGVDRLHCLEMDWHHTHHPAHFATTTPPQPNTQVVIFNDNSTFPDAVRFLDRLRASGVHMHDNKRQWAHFDELFEAVADFVEIYTTAAKSPYYVLTNPDCALDSAPWNLLQVYQHALKRLDGGRDGPALG